MTSDVPTADLSEGSASRPPNGIDGDDAMTAHNRVTLRVLTVAAFVVILNETIMTNAIPQLMTVFSVTAREAQWLSTGFMLTMAVVIPTTGWLLGRVGRRTSFLMAIGSFSVGTLISALAPTFEVLLAGRVVQAIGTAIMMPLLMSSVLSLVPKNERGRVMGNVSMAISVAPALGPAVSGVVLAFASWRWLFGLVMPVALLVLVLGYRLLEHEDGDRDGTLDLISVVLTAVGFGGVVYGLSTIGGDEHATLPPVPSLVVGAIAAGVFAWRQVSLRRREKTPLLDLSVVRFTPYVVAIAITSLSFMALMGAVIVLPIHLQNNLGLTALQAGLVLMPGALLMGLLGPTVGSLYDRVGPRPLLIPGAVAFVVGLGLMAFGATWAPWPVFLVLHVIVSLALALVFTPTFTAGLGVLPSNLYGHGSALLSTMQQVAAAAGTALVITVMSARQAAVAASGVPASTAIAQGVGAGLAVAAVLGSGAIIGALLMRRPAAEV